MKVFCIKNYFGDTGLCEDFFNPGFKMRAQPLYL